MVGQIALGSSRASRGVAKGALAATGLAAAVLLAACTSGGDGSDASGSAASGSSATDPGAAMPSIAGPTGPGVSSSSSAPSSTSAPRSPSGGGINQTVPSRTLRTKAPVALDSAASFGGRVTAKVSLAAIKAVGKGPGEVSGPALRVTFTVTNGSKSALALDAVTADLTDSAGDPAVSMNGSPASPFRGTVAAGSSRKGVYVFAVATNRRKPVTVSLNYSASAPVVIFKGNAS